MKEICVAINLTNSSILGEETICNLITKLASLKISNHHFCVRVTPLKFQLIIKASGFIHQNIEH